ncbi:hypothetical protein [Nocardia sp. NPDC059154]|uniref:hypothetical protein n=1 Tax=Nocardia sp. NPDC059154 TaxID=3346744 RepID=UPI0036807432
MFAPGLRAGVRPAPSPRPPGAISTPLFAPAQNSAGVGRCERSGHEKRLKEQPHRAFGVGVETEGVSAIDQLCDVAGKDRDKEGGGRSAEEGPCRLLPGTEQGPAESDLDDTGRDDDEVGIQSQPVRDLRPKLLALEGQVTRSGREERGSQSRLTGGPQRLLRSRGFR